MMGRLGVVLLFVCCLAGCGKSDVQETEIIRPVRYQAAAAGEQWRVRAFSGAAQAQLQSRLSFRVPGTVEQLAVKVGDRVTQGQMIAALDPTDYQLQLQQAEAELANARAQARNAAANYARIKALYENGNASRNDLDAARAGAESAGAGVVAAQKRLGLARSQLSYTFLRAPGDGAIAEVSVEVNENVASGQVIAVLTSGGPLEVEVAVPESLIGEIAPEEPVEVQFDVLGQEVFPARVTEVGVTAGKSGSTFPVTVRLRAEDPRIRPGMAAEVAFRFAHTTEQSFVLVPLVSVGEDRQGRFVYVVTPAGSRMGVVSKRAVEVGAFSPEGVEIVKGLREGEWVVTAGVSRIVDGQKVKILSSAGAGQ